MSDEARRAFGALLVDYGGVMTTSISASFAAFCVESGVDPQWGPPSAFSRPRLGRMEGARAVGMAGMLHKHPEVTIPKLEELLGIALG